MTIDPSHNGFAKIFSWGEIYSDGESYSQRVKVKIDDKILGYTVMVSGISDKDEAEKLLENGARAQAVALAVFYRMGEENSNTHLLEISDEEVVKNRKEKTEKHYEFDKDAQNLSDKVIRHIKKRNKQKYRTGQALQILGVKPPAAETPDAEPRPTDTPKNKESASPENKPSPKVEEEPKQDYNRAHEAGRKIGQGLTIVYPIYKGVKLAIKTYNQYRAASVDRVQEEKASLKKQRHTRSNSYSHPNEYQEAPPAPKQEAAGPPQGLPNCQDKRCWVNALTQFVDADPEYKKEVLRLLPSNVKKALEEYLKERDAIPPVIGKLKAAGNKLRDALFSSDIMPKEPGTNPQTQENDPSPFFEQLGLLKLQKHIVRDKGPEKSSLEEMGVLSLYPSEASDLEGLINKRFSLSSADDGTIFFDTFKDSPPEFLQIRVNRYTQTLAKDHTFIDFPENGIIRISYISGEENAHVEYEISAIIEHQGESHNRGHYLSYVKRNGAWYRCNDSQVRKEFKSLSDFGKNGFIFLLKKIR